MENQLAGLLSEENPLCGTSRLWVFVGGAPSRYQQRIIRFDWAHASECRSSTAAVPIAGFFIRDASRLPQVNWVRRGRVASSWEKWRVFAIPRSLGQRPKSAANATSQALPHHLIEKQHKGAIQSIRSAENSCGLQADDVEDRSPALCVEELAPEKRKQVVPIRGSTCSMGRCVRRWGKHRRTLRL